ncbi:AcrR family transcriptional regulator [Microbacteriaceae bacterium SG_E_30_P1]|uniref:AcrR family transcriptional regulator n=1 Tax=Antiquaquibacter oligotrophicus TaxID=2880260 RepID=A0ABT6KMK3_9MICO|nr:TetR/AcrR family transcriptional regulator [Antiquaquibacter oligotrophicus]MDH6181235.1 AcrR family transcriptional regulator [Antiquaquibacter oligotrophicus]UDF13070.1 TetR/AcrR family transcriptional regulator [Antiquaquibacter oligotrophicus]
MTDTTTRGRPQASSRETLQEAAFELFLENGYAGTTVEQITRRAGVSRNTFFNYFTSKSDVFWIDLDATLEHLRSELRERSSAPRPVEAVRDALLAVSDELGPLRMPWALTQYSAIGSTEELQSAAVSRLSEHTRLVAGFIGDRLAPTTPPVLAKVAAIAAIGAAVAATQEWAAAGPTRGNLRRYLETTLEPVVAGFGSV